MMSSTDYETTEQQHKDLCEPFKQSELEWRVQRSGMSQGGKPWAMVLCYVQSRAVMDRLDAVFGPSMWEDSYEIVTVHQERDGQIAPIDGVQCRIRVKYVDGNTVVKSDVSQVTDIEPMKGGYSGAIKRTGVKFGIGRYLYELPSTFADLRDSKAGMRNPNTVKINGKTYYWANPDIPNKFKRESERIYNPF